MVYTIKDEHGITVSQVIGTQEDAEDIRHDITREQPFVTFWIVCNGEYVGEGLAWWPE